MGQTRIGIEGLETPNEAILSRILSIGVLAEVVVIYLVFGCCSFFASSSGSWFL